MLAPAGKFARSQFQFAYCLLNNEVSSLLVFIELNGLRKKRKGRKKSSKIKKTHIIDL